uniref:Uncharacterized protein n=1 Tax=Rhipicephalus zambeziensis TaxID=60191 RepID=A0A224Y8H9_9ACAR
MSKHKRKSIACGKEHISMHKNILKEKKKANAMSSLDYLIFFLPSFNSSALCHCYHRDLTFSMTGKKRKENKTCSSSKYTSKQIAHGSLNWRAISTATLIHILGSTTVLHCNCFKTFLCSDIKIWATMSTKVLGSMFGKRERCLVN